MQVLNNENPALDEISEILDQASKGYITPEDILNFCLENSLDLTYSEAYSILLSLDSDFDGRIKNELYF